MADITFQAVTVPTPEPYAKRDSEKQRENLAYVMLQLIAQAKQAGFVLPDKAGLQDVFDNMTVNVSVEMPALDGIEQAIHDLKFNSVTFTLGNASFVFDGKTLTHLTSP